MVDRSKILKEGNTCWRIGRAERAAVLVDGAAYFGALRQALLKAKRSVFIVGWDIDSRVELMGEVLDETDSEPRRLGALLRHLVGRRPELQVHLVLWDYSVVYALEREPLPAIKLDWSTPQQIKVCLDDVLPLGACHHQKIVVIDDALAFCGGLDLTIRRWDTAEHRPDHPMRLDPRGAPYDPFHDIQMCVDGEAALALAELVRRRWRDAACEKPLAIEPVGDPWPEGLEPDFTQVDVAVARTLPTHDGDVNVREVEALFLAAIDHARRLIYLENQFFTADAVAERLALRLRENNALEALLVAPQNHDSWLEARSMLAGRIRFMRYLREAGVVDRVRLVHPAVTTEDGERGVMVHAKLMIVDDCFLRVGSANLNNRSMGLDTECDLAIEASGDEQRRAIADVRDRLLGEHLGVPAQLVTETLETRGSLLVTVDTLAREGRGLRPIQDEVDYDHPVSQAVANLADAEKPVAASRYVGDLFGGQPPTRALGRIRALLLVSLAVLGMALAWRFTSLSTLTDPDSLRSLFDDFAANSWAPIIVPTLFVVGGLTVFPVTVLIVLTAMIFEPWSAIAYATSGLLLSATATYHAGTLVSRKSLRNLMGRRLNQISRTLARRGVLSIMVVRLVPIAPFTLVNLVAGLSHIRFGDYLMGTLLGMGPGLLIVTALGHRLAQVLADPSAGEIALLALIVCLWLGISFGLQIVVSRLGSRAGG